MPATTAPAPTESEPVVLVVEDFVFVREVLRAGLRCHGFEVRLASDGAEAIELYRREHSAIALVLLDVQMPGMDGPAVLTALRSIEPDIQVFFMTGDAGRYGEDGLLAMGARRVFAKPIDITAVVAELRRSLTAVGQMEPAAGRRAEPDRHRGRAAMRLPDQSLSSNRPVQ
jgi:CheY-like chemotaxis protein